MSVGKCMRAWLGNASPRMFELCGICAYDDRMGLVMHMYHDAGSSVNSVKDECGWANDVVYIHAACAMV